MRGNQPMRPFATWLGRVVPLDAPFNCYAVWFGRVVWVGVIGNLLLTNRASLRFDSTRP